MNHTVGASKDIFSVIIIGDFVMGAKFTKLVYGCIR